MDNSIRQVTKREGFKMPIDSGEEWRKMSRTDQEEALRKITENMCATEVRIPGITSEPESTSGKYPQPIWECEK